MEYARQDKMCLAFTRDIFSLAQFTARTFKFISKKRRSTRRRRKSFGAAFTRSADNVTRLGETGASHIKVRASSEDRFQRTAPYIASRTSLRCIEVRQAGATRAAFVTPAITASDFDCRFKFDLWPRFVILFFSRQNKSVHLFVNVTLFFQLILINIILFEKKKELRFLKNIIWNKNLFL